MNADINLIIIFVLMGEFISESQSKFGHPGTPASATILLNGTYTWEYFQDIDNSARDHPISINTSLIGSYSSLVDAIRESKDNTSPPADFDFSGEFEIDEVEIKDNLGLDTSEIKNVLTNIVKKKHSIKTVTSRELSGDDFATVSLQSEKLPLYRLVFRGAGIIHDTDSVSTTRHPADQIGISLELNQPYFLSGIEVVYTKDNSSKPDSIISEVNGKNADLNAGFGGDYIWLVPKWTSRLDQGLTSLRIELQNTEDKAFKDLAKGAGGLYRYLKTVKDVTVKKRISEVALWRTDKADEIPGGHPWEGCTSDINQYRKKDYLYICWKST
ncbi:uncharacterized protein LOC110847405 [Folsomia candida]|uniref:uncharacterized protein LOC110847405 n=1 Tax=Folsomia candida TaxID=158441 RepID=UPI000B901651|nr:uncharacterized protein LOC110847405 [Folsomia candida]